MAISSYTPSADRIIHNTEVDFQTRTQLGTTVHLMQYDKSFPVVAVALYSNGQPYRIPTGAEMNVRVGKTDGTKVYNPVLGCNSNRTICYFEVTQQMSSASGATLAILELILNGAIAGSSYIPLDIARNPVQDEAIMSSDEYKSMNEIVAEAREALGKPPKIQNGTWWLWDSEKKAYADTGYPAQGEPGPQGEQGKAGATGPQGPAGKTPVKGEDYWTAADQTSMVNDVLEALPTAKQIVVKLTYGGQGYYGSDKSYADVKAAVEAGKACVAVCGNEYVLPNLEITEQNAVFYFASAKQTVSYTLTAGSTENYAQLVFTTPTTGDIPAASTASPLMDGTASAGSGTAYARSDHRHPTDTSRLGTSGNGSNVTVAFTQASTRSNLATGETLAVLFGKIRKWFSDLGTLAFKSSVAKPDLASAVQTSLDKADTALQETEYDPSGKVKAAGGIPDYVKATYTAMTLLSFRWSNKTYSLESPYPNASYDIVVSVAPNATVAQYDVFSKAKICGSANSNVLTALGTVPAVDIPVIVKAVRK